jgi:hypothetical protein
VTAPEPKHFASEDFSIVLGGPIYQLYLKTRLARPGFELLKRRLVGIPLLSWLPLLVLAIAGGVAVRNVDVPFLSDIGVHARFLGSIPLMIIAEVVVHRRIGAIVRQFEDRGLIAPKDEQRFEEIAASAKRLRNSVTAEVVQLVLAYALHFMWAQAVSTRGTTWVGSVVGGDYQYTAAGWWYSFVALPIFRLMMFRWYFRIFIWYRFLWQVRGLDLRLDALHPDRAAGLGFLSGSPPAFTPLLLAHSVLMSGSILNRIVNFGAKLPEFKLEIAVVLGFSLALVLTPLVFFMSRLAAAKRKGNADYGALASTYVAGFREKWLAGGQPGAESLIGTADIQSLSDLSGAYDAVRETRVIPLTRQAVLQILVVAALPILPLAFTMVPYEEVLMRVAGLLI